MSMLLPNKSIFGLQQLEWDFYIYEIKFCFHIHFLSRGYYFTIISVKYTLISS